MTVADVPVADVPVADVIVAGGGPAAWATAAACTSAGLQVTLVAPDPDAPWRATYGVWLDEVAGLDLPSRLCAPVWEHASVVGCRQHVEQRAYGRVDNVALAAHLRDRARSNGLRVVADSVIGSARDGGGSVVAMRSGRFLSAMVVVDATGHPGALVHHTSRRAVPAWQVGYGVIATFSQPPITAGTCMLMDWSPAIENWSPAVDEPTDAFDSRPSFLYAMDLGDGTFLVEETVLASRQPPTIEPLVGRLYARLSARGAHVLDVVAQEIVRIPMGAPVPRHQRVVATGAAGGLVHPATGYSLAASLRAAPAIASAIVAALDRRATADAVSAAAWAALWPVARRRVRALEAFGLSTMLRMGQTELAQFFDAFFELPIASRSSYLSGGVSLRDTLAMMRAIYTASPAAVRRRLSRLR